MRPAPRKSSGAQCAGRTSSGTGMVFASNGAMRQRAKVRLGKKVIHRHRVGRFEFRRVSELAFIGGTPKAILGWIDVGGVRTPVYLCDLDPAKLHQARNGDTWYYDDTTVDPRYIDVNV